MHNKMENRTNVIIAAIVLILLFSLIYITATTVSKESSVSRGGMEMAEPK